MLFYPLPVNFFPRITDVLLSDSRGSSGDLCLCPVSLGGSSNSGNTTIAMSRPTCPCPEFVSWLPSRLIILCGLTVVQTAPVESQGPLSEKENNTPIMSPRQVFHDDNPTRETYLRELCNAVHGHALFWFFIVFFWIHGCCFNQGLIIQAERVPHSLGRGHTVWLCTESPPKNGQGCHAVRRAGLMMDLLLAEPLDRP